MKALHSNFSTIIRHIIYKRLRKKLNNRITANTWIKLFDLDMFADIVSFIKWNK